MSLRDFMIFDEDRRRETMIIDKGYNIFVVWEKDYRENKENVIKNCINFLLN